MWRTARIGIGLFLLLIAANGVGLVIKTQRWICPCAGDFNDLSGDDVVGGSGSDYRLEKLKVHGGILLTIIGISIVGFDLRS